MEGAVTILAGTVLSQTERGALRDQAVTIAGGRITGIAPREEAGLAGRVVDWRDRTLLPGLADCHVHAEERAEMLVYLAHGITTLRNMRGRPWHLHWRRLVDEGAEPGPCLVTTSPMADGRGAPGTTVWPDAALIGDRAAARTAVRRWAELGYQQVKAYQWLSADGLAGLGEACRETGLPLVGHCPQALTVHEAIDRGQTCFEHLNNYEYGNLRAASQERLDAYFAQGFSYGRGRNRFSPEAAEAACDIDEDRIAELAQRLAAENIVSCPTLIVFDRVLGPRELSDPELRYVDPVKAGAWLNDFRFGALTPEELRATAALFHRRGQRILALLRDAGAPVLVGTDAFADNPFVFHGSTLVTELELMRDAGYTNAELVELATRGAADYLGLGDRGRIEVGFVADLVAVTGDPQTSVSALRDPAGVVVGGSVLERPDLDRLLAEAEALLHAAPLPLEPHDEPGEEYERTNFGLPDGATRVSLAGSTWRERVATRQWVETRETTLDADGLLVSARIERRRPEGVESAAAERAADGSYSVRVSPLDGSELAAELGGPLLPGADLGVPALLAAERLAATDDAPRVLTLSTSLSNGLAPVPGTVEREGDELVQRTTDAVVRVRGDDELTAYSLSAPLTDVVHRRTRG